MTNAGNLPVSSLDGRIDVLSFSSVFSYRPLHGLGITARYRRYDLDNKTDRIRFEHGYVRFDGVFEDIPRISVPYGYTNDPAVASASYDMGEPDAGGGLPVRRHGPHVPGGRAPSRTRCSPPPWSSWRTGLAARIGRDRQSGFRPLRAGAPEDASFLEPGAHHQVSLRRYDQAKGHHPPGALHAVAHRQGDRIRGYVRGKDDYEDSELGLTDALNEAVNIEADWTPVERLSLYAFYTHENIETNQVGRQSGSTPSVNPLDNGTAGLSDKVDFYGGGATAVLKPSKLDHKQAGTLEDVDRTAHHLAPPGGAPANPRVATGGVRDIGEWDDTRLLTVLAELG
jgi:hypothetical protein